MHKMTKKMDKGVDDNDCVIHKSQTQTALAAKVNEDNHKRIEDDA